MKNLIRATILIVICFVVSFGIGNAYYSWPEEGGTGIDTIPTAGQVLVGTSEGIYEPTSVLSVVTSTGVITFNSAFAFPASDGSANQILKTDGGGTLSWATDATGGAGTGTPAGVDGQLQYNNASSFGGASMLYYDDANDRVGIGENAPTAVLEVTTAGGSDPYFYITSSADGDIFSVLNNGNVGIGDTTPDYKLEVLNTNTQMTLTYADASTYTEMFTDVNGDLHIEPSGGDSYFTGNIRGTFIGNLTGNVTGALTGNASTATALAANPTDCAANQFADSIVASGNLGCNAIVDADVPDTITVDLATLATTLTITDNEATNEANAILFTAGGVLTGGNLGIESDGTLNYNPSTGTLTTTTFAGALTGNSSTATALATPRAIGGVNFDGTAAITPTTIVVADTEDATTLVGLWTDATGNLLPKTDEQLTYVANTGVLTAAGFAGPLTGAVTGNASTATALFANGGNCNAGEYALGVDASGAVESCTDATTEINSVVNGLGGTNLTCAAQSCNVDDVWWNALTDMVLTDNYIYVGDASNDPVGVAMSNDCTIASDGVITCDHDALANFVANEHLDWTGDLGAVNIHAGNYTDTNTYANLEIDAADQSTAAINLDFASAYFSIVEDPANDFDIAIQDIYLTDGASDTMTGTLTADGLTLGINENITLNSKTLDHDGSTFVFNDSTTVSGILTVTTLQVGAEYALPSEDGNANYVLKTDGSGNVRWAIDNTSAGGGETFAETLAIGADGNDVDQTSLGKLEFFDAGLYLDADADAVMNLSSDGTLELHSADWDISTTGVQTGMGNITSNGTVLAVSYSIGDATVIEAELEILDGANVTTTELNIIDGSVAATGTTLADADRCWVNDNGTTKQVALTDFETYFEAAIDTLANLSSAGGQPVAFADAGADAFWGWDDAGGATYENLTDAEAMTIIGGAATDLDGSGNVAWGNITAGELANDSIIDADIDDDGNFTFTGTWNFTGGDIVLPTLSVDAGTYAADSIDYADILDADQTDTKCIWFEDPTADDDFKSIWANKTANDFLITEIWAESDQTVTFDLQVDDGAPADCDSNPLAPAAGEAEELAIDGDCNVGAGEELDLVVTSVANTPTWVSICFTGNWVD